MPSRFPCPNCGAAYAYSPALLGRTYQCRQCLALFGVTEPPPGELAAATGAGGAKAPVPPPLPPRPTSSRRDEFARDDAPAEPGEPEGEDPQGRRTSTDRPTGVAALIGLLAAFIVGFFVFLGGVIYMLWPSSTPTNAMTEGPPPAEPAPLVVEPPTRLADILKEAPAKEK